MLKIAGLVLLGLVGLVLLICLMFLFIPVRYRLHAANAGISFKMSWFLGFFRLQYEDKSLTAWMFWFKRLGSKNKNKKKKKKGSAVEKSAKKVRRSVEKEERKERNKNSIIGLIKGFISYPDKGLMWIYIKRLIKRLLGAMKPRVFKARLDIGLNEPHTTGYLLGLASIIQGVYNLDLATEGHFDDKMFRYDVLVKDTFIIWSFAWALTAFCIRRPVRALIMKALGKDETNERDVKAVV